MKASDMDRQSAALPEMPTAREWLRLVECGIAIVLICTLWTFWA